MALMFGRFDIQSELSRSDTAVIYKALDMKSDQVVVLKTLRLEPLGDRSTAFVNVLLAEGESALDLVSQNIVALYGSGEIDGQFCAAMEYIQGNSIATMLAHQEGFSIWDLLDITRQVGAGLGQAASKGVCHCSLEPAKIMVQWDGIVKILGYGISNMGLIAAESGNGLGRLMPYCSPEQIRGEAIDVRSNLFTLGTILYEMVAGRKAFDADDPVVLVRQIENEMPPNPVSGNAKIHPGVNALIMKALAKDPADRYQSARELVDDLETCKEQTKKPAPEAKKGVPVTNVMVSRADRAAAARKFLAADVSVDKTASASSAPVKAVAPISVEPKPSTPPETGAAAAVAGSSAGARGHGSTIHSPVNSVEGSGAKSGSASILRSGAQAAGAPLASTTVEPGSDRYSARLPNDMLMSDPLMSDPLMSEPGAGSSRKSFSDLAEMPPLKNPVFAPPVHEPAEPLPLVAARPARKEEKPRIQPREVAEKAIQGIATVPPRLMLYSILVAVGLILAVALAVFYHVRSVDDGATAAPEPTNLATTSPASATNNSKSPPAQPEAAEPALLNRTSATPVAEGEPELTVRAVEKRNPHNRRVVVAAPAPVAITGEALIDSSPAGVEFQVDGKSDPSWIAPFDVRDLSPGKHLISASKAGYSSEIRSVDIAAGSKSSLMFHLSQVNAMIVVSSSPPGATVTVDGKPTGRKTPAQFSVEKGSHTVLLRKDGFLDEAVTAELGPAQNFQYAPVLRALGNTEDMRTVGKFNLFGRGDSAAGKGSIVIRTQPKGAQVAVNHLVLDKASPVGVVVAPGNYIVDITLTGFKPIHKVVSVERGDKAAIIETLDPQ